MTPSFDRDALLRPSLGQGARAGAAPYSQQVSALAAFFGGPVAALGMAGLNSRRLGRLGRDLPWLLLLLAGYLGLEWWMASSHGAPWLARLAEAVGGKVRPPLLTALGLLVFGLASVLHGPSQRLANVMGLDRPKGTAAGLGMIVAGTLVSGVIWMVLS